VRQWWIWRWLEVDWGRLCNILAIDSGSLELVVAWRCAWYTVIGGDMDAYIVVTSCDWSTDGDNLCGRGIVLVTLSLIFRPVSYLGSYFYGHFVHWSPNIYIVHVYIGAWIFFYEQFSRTIYRLVNFKRLAGVLDDKSSCKCYVLKIIQMINIQLKSKTVNISRWIIIAKVSFQLFADDHSHQPQKPFGCIK